MTLSRKHRILTALVALFGMLFMQVAVAAYACPGLGGLRQAVAEDVAAMQGMPDCDQLDTATPALCHAHCVDRQSSLDKPQSPVATPAAVIVAAILTPVEPLVPVASPSPAADSSLRRITSPPIAIRHCCLRI